MSNDMDDNAIFESAISSEPLAATPEIEEQVVVEEPKAEPEVARDDKGRFAKKSQDEQTETPEVEAAAPQGQEQAEPEKHQSKGWVPPFRLKEAQEEKRAAEERARQLEQQNMQLMQQMQAFMQQQAKPQQQAPEAQAPEIWENPDAYFEHRLSPIKNEFQKQLGQIRLQYSRDNAIARYGEEAVREADRAMQQRVDAGDLHEAQRILGSENPFVDLVEWYKKEQAIAKVGSDPEAYVQAQIDAMLKDPAKQAEILKRIQSSAQGASRSAPVTQIPPSLSKVAGGASAPPPPSSDADIFNHAISR